MSLFFYKRGIGAGTQFGVYLFKFAFRFDHSRKRFEDFFKRRFRFGLGIRVLMHIGNVKPFFREDRAFISRFLSRKKSEQRRFPRAVNADDTYLVFCVNFECHIFDYNIRAVGLFQPRRAEYGHLFPSFGTSVFFAVRCPLFYAYRSFSTLIL